MSDQTDEPPDAAVSSPGRAEPSEPSDEEAAPPSEPSDEEAAPSAEPASEPPSRSRRRPLVIVAGVVLLAVIGAGVTWRLTRHDTPTLSGTEAADALIDAYTRNLDATYLVEGELTRTLDDGRTLSSAYLTVQRPPDHIQRSLGSTTGDIGGRSVNCSTPPGGSYTCAASGDALPWDQQRATTLGALDSYVHGDDPVYSVTTDTDGCFRLVRRRTELDATYGREARLCFDPRYAAVRRLEVQRDGGATDVMLADRITDQVTGADFDLNGDSTYDPQVPDDTGTVPPTSS